jgi:hypothetical protein
LAASWWKKNNLLCLTFTTERRGVGALRVITAAVVDEDTITKANTATLEEVEYY